MSGNGTVTLALSTPSPASRSLAARESHQSRRPRLVVETAEAAASESLGRRVAHRGAQVHSLWGNSSLDDASRELAILQSAGVPHRPLGSLVKVIITGCLSTAAPRSGEPAALVEPVFGDQ